MTTAGYQTRPVGVVGAGTIGRGVAHAFAAGGRRVLLVDVEERVLSAARDQIASDARVRRLVDRAAPSPAPAEVLDRITFTTDHEDLTAVHYLVENVTERWTVKQELYQQLDRVCAPDCVFAVNTSAIPITRVASVTGRPDLVVGNHFMNPAHLMPLVEVVRGMHTGAHTVTRSRDLLAAIGKESIVVSDSPGFVTNRLAMLEVNEAAHLLAEGVSSAWDVDRLFRRCLGHRMGPLETADLIGLDTVLYSLEVLQEEFGEARYRPCPLLRRYVEAGWLGRKAGRGFHEYATTGDPEPASMTQRSDGPGLR